MLLKRKWVKRINMCFMEVTVRKISGYNLKLL